MTDATTTGLTTTAENDITAALKRVREQDPASKAAGNDAGTEEIEVEVSGDGTQDAPQETDAQNIDPEAGAAETEQTPDDNQEDAAADAAPQGSEKGGDEKTPANPFDEPETPEQKVARLEREVADLRAARAAPTTPAPSGAPAAERPPEPEFGEKGHENETSTQFAKRHKTWEDWTPQAASDAPKLNATEQAAVNNVLNAASIAGKDVQAVANAMTPTGVVALSAMPNIDVAEVAAALAADPKRVAQLKSAGADLGKAGRVINAVVWELQNGAESQAAANKRRTQNAQKKPAPLKKVRGDTTQKTRKANTPSGMSFADSIAEAAKQGEDYGITS